MADPNGFPGDPAPFTEGGKSGTASPQSHGSGSADIKPALDSLLPAPSPGSGEPGCPQAAGALRFDSPAAFTGGEGPDKGDHCGSTGSEGKEKEREREGAHSSHSEGGAGAGAAVTGVKRKIKEEPEGGHPNFLGVLDQSKGLGDSSSSSSSSSSTTSSSRPSPAKVPSMRGKSDSSRPTLQDVITQLAHSAGSQSGGSAPAPSPSPTVLPAPAPVGSTGGGSVVSAGGSAKAAKHANAERVAVKAEDPPGLSASPRDRGDKPGAMTSPADPSPRGQPPALSPKAATTARGRGRERKPKGDGCPPPPASSAALVAAHQGSSSSSSSSLPLMSSPTSSQALSSPGLAGLPPRMPLNGSIFPGMPMAYEAGFSYDYNLPDRGLGTSAFAGLPPSARFPALTPNMVGYFAGLGVPVAPWNLASPGALSAVAMDASNAGKPLDLSASHRNSVEKSVAEKPAAKLCPPAAASTAAKSAPSSSSVSKPKPAKEDKGKEKAATTEPGAEAESKPEPSAAKKPKYEKHMLIFGEKEVEIICVEKNCWIVRNEQELFDIIRSTSPQPRGLQKKKLSHMTPCDSASGSDCECLRSSFSQGLGAGVNGEEAGAGWKKGAESVKDDCECVTSSMKRGSADPPNVPSSSTQKTCGDCAPGEGEGEVDGSKVKVGKLKTTATSSTGSVGDSGEDDAGGGGVETPTMPIPSAMKLYSSSSDKVGGDKVKVKRSSVEEVVNLVCDDDDDREGSSSKCPVLQQMLKTSQ